MRENGAPTPVITSAGPLVDALKVLDARKIVVLCPYMKPLTKLVTDYTAHEGYEILDIRALEIPNNLDVARHDQGSCPGL